MISALLLAGVPTVASADAMEQWRDYAAALVAPSFDWYADQAQVEAPTVLSTSLSVLPSAAVEGHLSLASAASASTTIADRFGPQFAPRGLFAGNALAGHGIASDFAGTRLSVSGSGNRELGLSAIVARQQYSTLGFGNGEWDGSSAGSRRVGANGSLYESASGSGVRLDASTALGESAWTLQTAVQSRIEMDAFKAYRGVFSEAGDFDIPGFVSFAASAPLGQRLNVSAEVQRVFYSDVQTFSSSALPTRFLALLGDAGSPEFAWRDLTVYALETSLRDDYRGTWTLRLTSQQQPRPTSQLLDRALNVLYSDTNVEFDYRRASVGFGEFRLAASYSPVTYFLGSSPYVRRGFETGSQVEFEAQWILSF
ncbi:hypothetical protein [Pseudomarimonas arenosa]|uniref:Alginate export domain-containing protein n=1 Tax=Pseudomarimonas arenosa TaxID=2774145 RepID=A0AAW3ZKP6_9GAMM|nr:hypothetical protein [Pseudomarimonas arenosa]MBD8526010.1 hypothetical protein [Pseudomarimonas arenosa]